MNIYKRVHRLLIDKGLTLSTAESCTGGWLGKKITDIPGSSEYYKGGVITYSTESKIKLLGVKPETVKKYSVVSREVAEEMVNGVVKIFNTDIGISITGIAGPGGGTSKTPVGTVYTGFYFKGKTKVKKIFHPGTRKEVREFTIKFVYDELLKYLTK